MEQVNTKTADLARKALKTSERLNGTEHFKSTLHTPEGSLGFVRMNNRKEISLGSNPLCYFTLVAINNDLEILSQGKWRLRY